MKRFLYTILILAATIVSLGCPLSGVPQLPVPLESDKPVPLGQLVEQTLRDNLDHRRLATDTHGAWQVLHGLLAYGDTLAIETPGGTRPALQFLLDGGAVSGFEPAFGDSFGDPPRRGLRMAMQPSTKIGQGHRDQWLAVLTQCGLAIDAEIQSGEHTFTMLDWVRQTEYDIPLNLELEFSWTLIPLTHYHGTTHRWTARDGNEYSTELLLESELERDLAGSVCGGTHRLIGIAMAVNKRHDEQLPMSGVWADAEVVLLAAIQSAQENQNPDGSFSVAYLHRPGWSPDLGETLGTTGHVLEFLSFAADDETLRQPWVQRSVRRLCQVLSQCREVDLECGALYHALHGLAEYQQRVLQ